MQVLMPRYKDSLQRAGQMDPKQNGPMKTLLLGVLIRVENNEVVTADEILDLAGKKRYAEIATHVSNPNCLLVEVEHAEAPRIVQPPPQKPIAQAVGGAVNGSKQ